MTNRIKDRIVDLRRVRAGDLIPNPKNWRLHPKAQAEAMRGVLAEIGMADALLVRETPAGLMLIDGHLRADLIPDEQVPVLVLDLTESEADMLLATLDPLAAMAEASKDKLEELLRSIQTESDPLKDLLDDIAKRNKILLPPDIADPGAQIDQAEELQQKWGTEYGQLWQIGRHRLLCGDATNAEDVARVLDGHVPLLMVTDPPYGVGYEPNWRNVGASEGWLHYANGEPAYAASRVGKPANDDRVDWSDAWRLFPGDVAYTWSPGGDHVILTGAALQGAGFEIRNQIIWRKSNFPLSRGHYTYQHEPCWYGVKKGRQAHWIGDHNASTVWDITLDRNVAGGHSTQKPLECMARPIRNHEGDVYDPFLGSGTTMVAAEQLGRTCYAMEIEPKYVAVCLERLSKMGLDARLF